MLGEVHVLDSRGLRYRCPAWLCPQPELEIMLFTNSDTGGYFAIAEYGYDRYNSTMRITDGSLITCI